MNEALPAYTEAGIKAELLAAGVAGTVYALVMPETERALAQVVDGCERQNWLHDNAALDQARSESWLGRYHEPWTQHQDDMHEAYFERWLAWSSPVVSVAGGDFPFRYPTAGASEGIYKLTAEHAAHVRSAGDVQASMSSRENMRGSPRSPRRCRCRSFATGGKIGRKSPLKFPGMLCSG